MENANSSILQVSAKVKLIRYDAGKSGFKIAVISIEGRDETIKGLMPGLVEGGYYHFELSPSYSEKYGHQYDVKNFKSEKPLQIDDLEAFLASGMFKGIGEKTAGEIVKHFGKGAYDVILNDIDRLLEVKGIGPKLLEKIKASIHDTEDGSALLYNLVAQGFTPAQAKRIVDVYGDRAYDELKKNPYSLCFHVRGLSLATVDKVAKRMGFDLSSQFRLEAIIDYCLKQHIYSRGHHYALKAELYQAVSSHADLSLQRFEELIQEMYQNAYLEIDSFFGEERIYSKESLYWEEAILAELMRIAESYQPQQLFTDAVSEMKLSEEQLDAIKGAFDEGIFILTGPAGSGKTTVLKELINRAEALELKIAMAAPTGRAAARMEEVVGLSASTVHRLLEFEYNEDEMSLYFKRGSDYPLSADVIFIDESSMLDSRLFLALLEAIKDGALLVLIGDINQLPPVGPGSPLKDLIKSRVCNMKELKGVHRQEFDSDILGNARAILRDEAYTYNRKGGDFYYIESLKSGPNLKLITKLVSEIVPEKFGFSPDDITVLSPVKDGPLGINSLNRELQKALNPNAQRLYFGKFALGDKVMQQKNDYELSWVNLHTYEKGKGVFNGDIGRITEISNSELSVEFQDGRLCEYSPKDILNLDLAYALTIHKSQGNEFETVILPSFFFAPIMRSKNLMYTAVTRAKKLFIMTGNKSYFEESCKARTSLERRSALSERLKLAFDER